VAKEIEENVAIDARAVFFQLTKELIRYVLISFVQNVYAALHNLYAYSLNLTFNQ